MIFLSFSNCFDKKKVLNDLFKNLSDEELFDKIGMTVTNLSYKEMFFDKLNYYINSDYNNCAVRKDFELPDLFMFMPILKGKLFNVGDKFTYANHCFQQNTIEYVGYANGIIRLNIEAYEAKELFCQDSYLFHTPSILHGSMVIIHGSHNIDITVTEEQMEEIKIQGLRIFSLCEGLVSTIKSIIATYHFFTKDDQNKYLDENGRYQSILTTNDNDPSEREQAALDFREKFCGARPQLREGHESDILPVEKYIRSGDYLGMNVIDSPESCFISYLGGGAASHAALAVRVEEKLYVLESNDYGVIFTPWDDFIKEAIRTNHTLMWFPLSEENSKKFNSTKAYEWIKKRIGQKYGLKCYFAGGYDTTKDTLPEYLSPDHITMFMDILEKIEETKLKATYFFSSPMNARLGTKGLNISEIGLECSKRGLILEEVFAMPELESYFENYGEENWVCSAIVMKVYMEAGVLNHLDILPSEFLPRDIYQMKIFDEHFNTTWMPKECKEADPGLNYCQILGKYRIIAEGYNTIIPYDHMNNNCPIRPPKYYRPDGC